MDNYELFLKSQIPIDARKFIDMTKINNSRKKQVIDLVTHSRNSTLDEL
ncbi:hypothetical protein [uncultured Gammaproteobacteria bacterium]|nr:hypothetical protein [uncultured Gammaproteobacteria bacterium]